LQSSPTILNIMSASIQALTSLSAPSPACFHVSRTPAPPAQSVLTANINPTDNFFGYTFSSSRTHESRHEQSLADTQSPPPYVAEDADLPAYARKAPEPITLAKYLFKFGFCTFFPPSFYISNRHLSYSPYRSIPSILDHGCPHPSLAPARSFPSRRCRHRSCMAAGEDRGGARRDHRTDAQGRGQVGDEMSLGTSSPRFSRGYSGYCGLGLFTLMNTSALYTPLPRQRFARCPYAHLFSA
jgi:hypothetical protein